MTTPFDPPERDPRIEAALRDSLRSHADDAPDADALAERILATTQSTPHHAHRRSLALPAVAAAVVAGIVGIALAVVVSNSDPDRKPAAQSSIALPASQTPSPTGSPSVAPQSSARSSLSSSPSPAGDQLTGVRVIDLSFTGQDDGWALASADCIHGPGRCTAVLRTTDGHTWVSHPGRLFNVPGVDACTAPCVDHLRFADDSTGYAFSSGTLLMTVDGGQTWTAQDGGALGLETADNNVVRLVRGTGGVQVRTAPIGSSSWTARSLGAPATAGTRGAYLTRNGADVYVLLVGDSQAFPWTSSVFRSTDDGVTWSPVGNPCPKGAGTVQQEGVAIASGSNGRVAVACRQPQTAQSSLVTSDDRGASFTGGRSTPQRTPLVAIGPVGVYLLAGDGLSRTQDGGRHWSDVAGVGPGYLWFGFENDRVGRVVDDGGATIWTTRDGGSTWKAVHFS